MFSFWKIGHFHQKSEKIMGVGCGLVEEVMGGEGAEGPLFKGLMYILKQHLVIRSITLVKVV